MRSFRFLLFSAIICCPASALAWTPPPFELSWGGPGTAPGKFNMPYDLVVDAQGVVYVADVNNFRVQTFDSEGQFLASWGTSVAPISIAVTPKGTILIAYNTSGSRIDEFLPDGSFANAWSYSELHNPSGIGVDANGFIYVSDSFRNKVYKFTSDGSFLRSWPLPALSAGGDVAVDDLGLIYVVDRGDDRVNIFDPNGASRGYLGSSGVGPGQFSAPTGVTSDASGYVYVTDAVNDRVEVFRRGDYVGEWGDPGTGPGQFESPKGIGVGPDGSVYVADQQTNLVQKFGLAPVPAEALTLGRIKAMYRGEKATLTAP